MSIINNNAIIPLEYQESALNPPPEENAYLGQK